MGCGCGRSRVSAKAKAKQLKLLRKGRAARNILTKSNTLAAKRKKFCYKCPSSAQTKKEIQKRIWVCHKSGRLINNILLDKKFKCPLKKFKAVL